MFYEKDFLKELLRDDEIYLRLYRTLPANEKKGYVPSYQFLICTTDGHEAGICDLRIGHNELLYYGGNIGYMVKEPYRGHHYAGKACKLLFKLAALHELEYLYITCNPENIASRKSCEYAGLTLQEIVDVPPGNEMYRRGEFKKCIYYTSSTSGHFLDTH